MNIEGKTKINPAILKKQGDYMKERLYNVAWIADKLQKNGWVMCEGYGAIYNLSFYNDSVKTIKQAKTELKKLGIKAKNVNIMKLEDA